MDEQTRKERIGQIRGFVGLALAVAWIAYWWAKLEAAKQAALAQPCDPGFFGKAMDVVAGAGSACRSAAENQFAGGMFGAVITAPLAFLVAHMVARWRVGQLVAHEAYVNAHAERQRQQDHQKALDQLGDAAALEASASRRENDRHELITRLGAVDDQLIVLEGETEPDRVTRIKMSISQALREIDAKFTDDELQALAAAHPAIRQRVDRTLADMCRLGLEGGRQHQDLAGMFGRGGTTEADRALDLS